MTPSVSPEADAEVGLAFILECERALALLCGHSHLGAPWRNGRRRFPLRKFPYSIVYYALGEELRVVALAHHRRRPSYWSGRK
jgi:plasmid stabilization system protein ParE